MSHSTSRGPLRTRLLAAFALAALGLLAAVGGARSAVTPLSAGMESGNLSEFSQASTSNGTLQVTSERAFAGSRSAKATYRGGGSNGYARGIWNVNWRSGETVTYSAAFYLPAGFHNAMQGQVSLLRWDNYGAYGNTNDKGGIAIFGSDKRAYLVRTREGSEQAKLVGPINLPEGRWFTLAVTQRLATTNPYSEVRLDGRVVGTSSAQNFYGRAIDRLRVGIVAIAAGSQRNGLTLYFDEARVASGGAQSPAPQPQPEPQPQPQPEPQPQPQPEPQPQPQPGPQPQPQPGPRPSGGSAPSVRLTSPRDGSRVRGDLVVAARASDDRRVARVRFYVDGRLRNTDRTAPYRWVWRKAARKLSRGRHTVTARAFDDEGRSAAASVRVFKR